MSSESLITVAIDSALFLRARAYALKREIALGTRVSLRGVIEEWLQAFLDSKPSARGVQPTTETRATNEATARTKLDRTIIAQIRAYALSSEIAWEQPMLLRTVIEHVIEKALNEAETKPSDPDGTP